MRRSVENSRGFTLVEMMVVLGVVGVLAAIAIANYGNAMNRARQKKSMADMRAVAIAWESRASDHGRYNAAGFDYPANVYDGDDMVGHLTPTYIRTLPRDDGWENPFDFAADAVLGAAAEVKTYAIRSRGRDNIAEGPTYTATQTTRFDCDIVFSNGNFVVYPAGVTLD
jgi:type II secretion system protein G